MKLEKIQGIIFDMDNTLLQSHIDFSTMKNDLYTYLVQQKAVPKEVPLEQHTCATVIELAKQKGMTTQQEETVWSIVQEHELTGMKGVELEQGAREVLEALKENYIVVILTNNAQLTAERALMDTGIYEYFDIIVGREKMSALKPSSSGVEYILEAFPEIPSDHWIFIGDSWIDGMAAKGAGISFISYRTDQGMMKSKDITPFLTINKLQEIITFLEASK